MFNLRIKDKAKQVLYQKVDTKWYDYIDHPDIAVLVFATQPR